MFGFEARNNSAALTISDSYPNLVFITRGQVIVQNSSVTDRPANGSVSYPTISQMSPPNIFIRYNSGRHSSCNIYMSMIGTPGNWTGFSITASARGGSILPRDVIDYVVCASTPDTAPSDYGLAVYDVNGRPTYKSEDMLVKYSKFTKSWYRSDNGGQFVNLTPSGVSIDFDDYIDISSMNRGNIHMNTFRNFMFSSMTILSGGVRTLTLVTQNSTSQGDAGPLQVGSTFFCIPICKFP